MIDNIITLLSENIILAITFALLIIVYIVFEIIQLKSKANGVTPQMAVYMLNRQKAVFIDIRDGKLYQQGHIVDALSTTVNNLKDSTKFLQKYKVRPIIVYCDNGTSAKQAVAILKAAGFEKVYNLQGGLKAWKAEKLPIQIKKVS
ncbi:rhodanese-like domain-containing protein [Thiotrichales bacterium 19S3-7]|nr:rhodanese-like domain-containing protein [Thiotrichales bacterium 19S3-7]MCF6802597.1 rhodanese-like domain-containing protein [Thiotrichales bacterium 19S3-11]